MGKTGWNKTNIPSLEGKLAIVTGATGGLGYETALAFAQAGADVILASRNESKGEKALEEIRQVHPEAKVSFEKLDLGSLQSVADFCTRFNSRNLPLDILVNNAGLASYSGKELTVDGLECQIGTNYLGHFALTAQLLPSLQRCSSTARVINVSSVLHVFGNIGINDLQSESRIWKMLPAFGYCKSKLANLVFTLELQRRSEQENWGIVSMAAHPGFASTDIANEKVRTESHTTFTGTIWKSILTSKLSHSAEKGALPIIYAAVSPDAQPGQYYGPDGFMGLIGAPHLAYIHKPAKSLRLARKLWEKSVTLTGVQWPQSS